MKKPIDQDGGDQVLDVEALTETGAAPGHVFGSGCSAWAASDDGQSLSGKRAASSSTGSAHVGVAVQGLSYEAPRGRWLWGSADGASVLTTVTGRFAPGTFTIVTGPSGSGKGTLLSLLAGRKNAAAPRCSVLFSGAPPTRAFLRRNTGYVEREDALIPRFTVEEMISYTADLKLPLSFGAKAKRAAVEDVIRKLGLEGCRNRLIGDSLRKGISRGEARRVSVALQVVGRPSVLFMDEPTCGLDVVSANKVIALARDLANEGVTVVAAIERPTEFAFEVADSLVVLLRGQVAYWGPSGGPALEHAASLNLPAAKAASSAPRGVEWLCGLYGAAAEDPNQVAALAASHKVAPSAAGSAGSMDVKQEGCPATACAVGAWGETAAPWLWTLATLLRYRGVRRFASGWWLAAHVPDKLVMGAILGAIYYGMAAHVTVFTSLQVSSLLLLWNAVAIWLTVAFLPTIITDRRVFVRERDDGLYRPSAYLAARILEDFAVATPATLAACALVFALAKAQGSFAVFWLAYWSAACCGIAIAHGVAAWSPAHDVANAWMPLLVATFLFFAGYLMPIRDLPAWLAWVCRVNPLHYAWAASMGNQFAGTATRFVNGQPILLYFGLLERTPLHNVGLVWAFTGGAMVIALAGLHVRRHFLHR